MGSFKCVQISGEAIVVVAVKARGEREREVSAASSARAVSV